MPLKFYVQEHHARNLHWDFRLERNGVLRSWAVPKVPPQKAGIKRLAVQVSDHPMNYGKFQGTIPHGMYGAGRVETWDEGTYELVTWEADKIVVFLYGNKLKGKYTLLKFAKAGENNWLFFKSKSM